MRTNLVAAKIKNKLVSTTSRLRGKPAAPMQEALEGTQILASALHRKSPVGKTKTWRWDWKPSGRADLTAMKNKPRLDSRAGQWEKHYDGQERTPSAISSRTEHRRPREGEYQVGPDYKNQECRQSGRKLAAQIYDCTPMLLQTVLKIRPVF
jgi:hypothetical protein